jgi:hypothetical protein
MDLTKTTNIADGTAAQSSLVGKSVADPTAGSAAPYGPAHSPLAHEWPLLLLMVIILTTV